MRAALSGSWMSNHSRQSMFQSIMRGLGLFVSYDINGDRNALWIMLRGVFWCRRDDIARGRYVVPPDFIRGISRRTSPAGLSSRNPS